MTIGEIVKKRREEKGLTMRELSTLSGVSLSTINRTEHDAHRHHKGTLMLLAAALGTTAGEIMEEHDAGLRKIQSSSEYKQ